MKKPSIESQLFEALAFAAHKHRAQRRKDVEASPYINHPIALARTLAVEGGVTDTRTLIAAVLHDTVEDTDTTFEEIGAVFGAKVADIVREVTDDTTLDKADRKRLQIEHAPHLSKRAALVKLADKTSNLRDVASSLLSIVILGGTSALPDSAARAASTASMGSDLPWRRRAWRLWRSTSITSTPARARNRARPAP